LKRNKHNSELEEEPPVRTQPFILGIHRGNIPQILYSPKTNHFETPDPQTPYISLKASSFPQTRGVYRIGTGLGLKICDLALICGYMGNGWSYRKS